MKQKKTLALLVSLVMLLSACSQNPAESGESVSDNGSSSAVPSTGDVSAEEETEAAPEEDREQFNPHLEAKDYGGATFTALYNSGSEVEPNKDFTAEELNGEIVNDAKFNRGVTLAEKYNLSFDYQNGGGDGTVAAAVTNSVSAGDNAYQTVDLNAQYCVQLGSKGALLQIKDLPVIDMEAPYWNSLMQEGSSISGKNFFVFSDINIHAYGATPCMIFNKVVHENFGLPDLYEIVLNGGWTFDRACEMISAVTGDLDGDGAITKDEADLPVINVYTEEMADIMNGIKRVCSEQTGTFLVDRTSTATEAREYWTERAITEDRALFWVGNIKCVERMRTSESDFGVVPMPKASEAQANYAIHVQANVGSMLCFPLTVAAEGEMVGSVMEDMAFLSFRDVMPAYMDVCINGKVIRDEESLACLELIRSSYYCDLGFMCQQMGINILNTMRDYVTKNKEDYMSALKSSQKVWNKSLEKIAKNFVDEP